MGIARRTVQLCVGWTLAALAAGCAAPGPVPGPTRVISMSAQEAAAREGFPPAGAIWRLDEQELKALGPILPTPDPPPPHRLDERDSSGPQWVLTPSFVYFGSNYGFGINVHRFPPGYYRYPYYGRYGHPWR